MEYRIFHELLRHLTNVLHFQKNNLFTYFKALVLLIVFLSLHYWQYEIVDLKKDIFFTFWEVCVI